MWVECREGTGWRRDALWVICREGTGWQRDALWVIGSHRRAKSWQSLLQYIRLKKKIPQTQADRDMQGKHMAAPPMTTCGLLSANTASSSMEGHIGKLPAAGPDGWPLAPNLRGHHTDGPYLSPCSRRLGWGAPTCAVLRCTSPPALPSWSEFGWHPWQGSTQLLRWPQAPAGGSPPQRQTTAAGRSSDFRLESRGKRLCWQDWALIASRCSLGHPLWPMGD